MTDLNNMSIIVVGASGGLGSQIVSILQSKGAALTLVGRDESRLREMGTGGNLVAVDATVAGAAQAIVASAKEFAGSVDGVIYAAGAVAFGSVGELGDEVIEKLWKINVQGWMSLLRESIPELTLSAQGGRAGFAMTLSGVVAEAPTAGIAAYSAVKSALSAYSQAASRELRRSGIRLIDARPGHTETELSKHPLAGVAPAFPAGLDPQVVASRLVEAIENGEKDLPSSSF